MGALGAGAGTGGGGAGRGLMEYDAASGDVRVLRLAYPRRSPPRRPPRPRGARGARVGVAVRARRGRGDDVRRDPPRGEHGRVGLPLAPAVDARRCGRARRRPRDRRVPRVELRRRRPRRGRGHPSAAAAAHGGGGGGGGGAAMPCVAIDHGLWAPLASHSQAVWLGDGLGDSLLLFDAVSGAYEVWPLRRLPGRTMPRPGQVALARGVWPALIGRTLVHGGASTLIALAPTSGAFDILLLDSSSLLLPGAAGVAGAAGAIEPTAPAVSYGRLASGTLGAPTTGAAGRGRRRARGPAPLAPRATLATTSSYRSTVERQLLRPPPRARAARPAAARPRRRRQPAARAVPARLMLVVLRGGRVRVVRGDQHLPAGQRARRVRRRLPRALDVWVLRGAAVRAPLDVRRLPRV